MRTLYFDCFSGVSGDMLLGALVDLGVDTRALEREIAKLGLENIRLVESRVERSTLSAVKIDVVVGDKIEAPGGRPEEYGHLDPAKAPAKVNRHSRSHAHGRTHDHHHEHPHEHEHLGQGSEHMPVGHSHEHGHDGRSRTLAEILDLIARAELPERVKERAMRAFGRLGEAEARMHGTTPESVHFHEVGAADAIVDVVGSMLGFEMLGVERFVCSPINVGGGSVTFSHGTFPVPAPATAELLRGAPIYSGETRLELATPTGAAVVSTVATEFGPMPELRVDRVGYGAGARDVPRRPNVLRLLLGDATAPDAIESSRVAVIEAAIDDSTPEALGFFIERALAGGALDVYAVPAMMKKNRPGVAVTLICDERDLERMTKLVFSETTTLGLRHRLSERRVLERESVTVETRVGPIRVKLGRAGGEVLSASPEFEDCREAALRSGIPLKEVQAMAIAAYRAKAGSQ